MSGMFFSDFLFISTHTSLDLLSLGSAEAYTVHWVRWETKRSFDGKLCQEYLYKKIIKIWSLVSKFRRKCRGCFLGHSV